MQQGTGESKLQAIAVYSQALLIWRKIGKCNSPVPNCICRVIAKNQSSEYNFCLT
ncbi:hypothetical protein [Tolypothrix sp. VBCCA 56010]|uniref:hypothetical protein n=1 Tax=Tolypothrix sp. VBCCA 56010 TaxID=3137731 RepID=UPI003D7E3E30